MPSDGVTYDDRWIFTSGKRKVRYEPVGKHYFFFDRLPVLLLLVVDLVPFFLDFPRDGGWRPFFPALAAFPLSPPKFPDALVGDFFFDDEAPPDCWAPPEFFYLAFFDLFLLVSFFLEMDDSWFFSAAVA